MPDRDPFAGRRMCRGCGCTDRMACPGGCSWVLLDIKIPTGFCSRCAELVMWLPQALAQVGLDEETIEEAVRYASGFPAHIDHSGAGVW